VDLARILADFFAAVIGALRKYVFVERPKEENDRRRDGALVQHSEQSYRGNVSI
jgi:hypothetical protein